jgi:streptogramin lyase
MIWDPTNIAVVAVAPDGVVWVGTWGGETYRGGSISHFDGQTWTTKPGRDGLMALSITAAPDGSVWFGTIMNGVSRLGEGTWSWTNYNEGNGLADDSVKAIAVGPDGSLWFGTCGGVSRFAYTANSAGDGETWITYTKHNGLACDSVESIVV